MPLQGIKLPLLMASYDIACLSSSNQVSFSSEDGVIVSGSAATAVVVVSGSLVVTATMKSMGTRKKHIKHIDGE